MELDNQKWFEQIKQLPTEKKKEVYELFSSFFSENKKNLLNCHVHNRTRHITVVLENLYQSQNASAVLRTSECFGIQDIHVVENEHEYQVNPDIALGASKWVDIYKYNQNNNNTETAYKHLKSKGYRIAATLPHTNDVLLQDLDISEKTALVFGTEKEGLSNYAIANADAYVKVPMYGFTESFNVSVSAAICLFYLTEKMRNSNINWQLTEDEKTLLKIHWAKSIVHNSEKVFREAFTRWIEQGM